MKQSIFILGLLVAFASCSLEIAVLRENMKDPQCLADSGYSGIFSRALTNDGKIDPSAKNNIRKAMDVFRFLVLIIIEPCATCSASASDQVESVYNALSGVRFGGFAVVVDSANNAWAEDKSKNCAFIQEALDAITSGGQGAGIVSDKELWDKVAGASCTITPGRTFVIWLKKNQKKDYIGFRSFGGLPRPILKIYDGPKEVCKNDIDLGYRAF